MNDDMKTVQWLMGVAVAFTALVGGVVTRDRQMAKQIRDSEDRMHDRINKVKDDYVKRSDMEACMARISDDVSRLRDEIREDRQATNQRLDTIINSVTKSFSQAAIERNRS